MSHHALEQKQVANGGLRAISAGFLAETCSKWSKTAKSRAAEGLADLQHLLLHGTPGTLTRKWSGETFRPLKSAKQPSKIHYSPTKRPSKSHLKSKMYGKPSHTNLGLGLDDLQGLEVDHEDGLLNLQSCRWNACEDASERAPS